MTTADLVEQAFNAGLTLPPGVFRLDRPVLLTSAVVPLASRAAEDDLLKLLRAHGAAD